MTYKQIACSLFIVTRASIQMSASAGQALTPELERQLLNAACPPDLQGFGGDIYRPSVKSTRRAGKTVYTYNVEGCGGGNHVETFVTVIREGKVESTREQ